MQIPTDWHGIADFKDFNTWSWTHLDPRNCSNLHISDWQEIGIDHSLRTLHGTSPGNAPAHPARWPIFQLLFSDVSEEFTTNLGYPAGKKHINISIYISYSYDIQPTVDGYQPNMTRKLPLSNVSPKISQFLPVESLFWRWICLFSTFNPHCCYLFIHPN